MTNRDPLVMTPFTEKKHRGRSLSSRLIYQHPLSFVNSIRHMCLSLNKFDLFHSMNIFWKYSRNTTGKYSGNKTSLLWESPFFFFFSVLSTFSSCRFVFSFVLQIMFRINSLISCVLEEKGNCGIEILFEKLLSLLCDFTQAFCTEFKIKFLHLL